MRALLSRLFFGDYKFNLEGAPLAHLCFLHHFTDSTLFLAQRIHFRRICGSMVARLKLRDPKLLATPPSPCEPHRDSEIPVNLGLLASLQAWG